jgi:hypothetical protein
MRPVPGSAQSCKRFGCFLLQSFEPVREDWLYEFRFKPGGCHVPLPIGRIEGGSLFGQYSRITKNNGPFGAGSQLAFLPGVGGLFWM